MGNAKLRESITIDAPIEHVFERLVDHEAMSDWPGVGRSRLVVEGSPERNGLGAVRAIRAKGVTLLEEVVRFEPPTRMDYTITKGLPVEHLGVVRLEEVGGSVELTWEVTMSSRWPGVSAIVIRLLGNGLPTALAFFKEDTERRHRAG